MLRVSTPLAEIVSEPHDARFGTWMMPGSSAAKPSQLREMLGSWVSSPVVRLPPICFDVTSMSGASLVTVTVSSSAPRSSETGTVVVVPTVTGRSRLRKRLKPVSSADTW